MDIEPTMTKMQPKIINRQLKMTPVSVPGPRIQLPSQSSIGKSQPPDPKYSVNSAFRAGANPLNRNSGIDLQKLSKYAARNNAAELLAQSLMNHFYGGRIYA